MHCKWYTQQQSDRSNLGHWSPGSIISGHFLDKTFPDLKVREISELIEADLSLTTANGSPIKYTGWVQLDFKLSPEQDILHVPFLVTKEQFDLPVIGFNIIEQFIKSNNFEHDTLNSVFHKISSEKVGATVNFIWSAEEDDLGITKTCATRDYVIPKGDSINIPCRVNHGPIEKRTPVLFEPDETQPWPTGLVIPEKLITVKQGQSSQIELEVLNTTHHNIVLPKRAVLGHVQLVQSLTPVEVKFKAWPKEKPVQHENKKLQAATSEIPAHLKSIDLEGLDEEQKQLALDLFIEEQESFAKNDDDIGVIPDLKLDINLTDKAPVQKNYVAVPRPLYPETNSYIEDLLNRQFIRKSKSPYSSPVVCF